MKKLFSLIILLAACTLPVHAQTPVTVTGTITDASNTPAISGYVQFDLQPSASSIHYFVSGIAGVDPQSAQCGINATGQVKSISNLANPCTIWGNDVITPGNTTYKVTFAPNGNVTNVVNGEKISGSTYNLNNPVFAPIVQISPQQNIVRSNPFQTNILPIATNTFNIGSPLLQYAAVYTQNLFLNGVQFNPANFPLLNAPNTWLALNTFTAGLVSNTLTASGLVPGNCVQAGTGGILTSTVGACGTSSGTVTVTGTPANGNLTKFSGGTSITNADLTGDVTTSGSVSTTLATVATPATNTKITYNAKGLVTSGAQAQFTDIGGVAASAQIPQINLAVSGAGGVGGNLPVTNLNSGSGASSTTCWRGDGTWGSCGGVSVAAVSNLTVQGANIGATTLLTPGADGFYRMSCYLVITRVATTSSTLPACQFNYTDADSNVAGFLTLVTTNTNNILGTNSDAGISSTGYFQAKAGGVIQYQTTGYTSVGATSMQYAVHVRLEGPF